MAVEPAHTEAPPPGAHTAFPPFQSETFGSQIIWLAVTFGALYLLMSKVALPRVARTLAERRERIDGQIDDAKRMQARAQEASVTQDKALADARATSQALAQAARDQRAAEAEASRKGLEAELSGRLATAEAQIAATMVNAMTNVDAIAIDAATAIVERLTGKAPAQDAVASAVASAKTA